MSDRKPIVIFEDPPEHAGARARRHPLEPELMLLAEHPGEWGRIATRDEPKPATQIAYGLRKSRSVRRRLGVFEVRAGQCAPGEWGVWARFIGCDGEEPS